MKLLMAMAIIGLGWLPFAAAAQAGLAGTVEDVFIARSVRTTRVKPTDFCAESRVGFGSVVEDRFTFHATATRSSDGQMVESLLDKIGQLHACFGVTSNALTVNFYAEGDLAGVSFTGKGDCDATKMDFPEPGITIYRCFLDLSNLPRGYVGGLLTTSSVLSREPLGTESSPAGYVQSSVATVRVWKPR